MGLREQKKARTRTNLTRCGIRLFADRGFRSTTVADIAAAAEVAPSTFFLHFATKHDLLFNAHDVIVRGIGEALDQRPKDALTVDVIHDYLLQRLASEESDELLVLRRKIIDGDPELVGREHQRYSGTLRPMLIRAYAHDLQGSHRTERATLLAALTIGAITELGRIASPDGRRNARAARKQREFLENLAATLRAAYGEVEAVERVPLPVG
jgi:AcrR family transcriptional regulator